MERNAQRASGLNGSFDMSHHRCNLGGRTYTPPTFFVLKNFFLLLSWRGTNIKNRVESGGRCVCVYMTGSNESFPSLKLDPFIK